MFEFGFDDLVVLPKCFNDLKVNRGFSPQLVALFFCHPGLILKVFHHVTLIELANSHFSQKVLALLRSEYTGEWPKRVRNCSFRL